MRRREFLGVFGGVAAGWPLAARGQQPGKLPIIGFLGPTTSSVSTKRVAVFLERLHELGWTESRTVEIEYRWADGKAERFEQMAAEFVQRKVDVIFTFGTETALAAKKETAVIPIVFTLVGDPIGSGLVASLARPGGNVTGLSAQHADTAGKRLELLREVLPSLRRLAVMANVANPGPVLDMRQFEAAASKLGIEVIKLEIRNVEDIAPALKAIEGRVQALYVTADAMLNTNRNVINSWALRARLPTLHGFSEIVAAGGLMSYAPNYLDLFRRSAEHVDKILRGTKPASIPVEQPTKFELVINLKTAKMIGLTIPESFLVRADEVIE